MAASLCSPLKETPPPPIHPYTLVFSSYLVTNLMGADLNNIVKFQRLSDEHVQFLIYQLLRGLKVIYCITIHLLYGIQVVFQPFLCLMCPTPTALLNELKYPFIDSTRHVPNVFML